MGLRTGRGRPRMPLAATGGLLVVLLLAAAIPAFASVYGLDYAQGTGTVRPLSVTLQTGDSGSSAVSTVSANAATASVTAGLEFYVAGPPSSCTAVTANTALTVPAAGSASLSRGSSYCLWSLQYSQPSTIYAGNWTTDLWLDAKKPGFGMTVSVETANSAGVGQSTIFNGTTSSASTSESEVTDSFAGAGATVPAGGYLVLMLTPPSGGRTPVSWDIYWGTGQASNFRSPSQFDYVLSVANSASASWSVSLATGSALATNIGRLSNLTIWFPSPFGEQVAITNGTLTQASGLAVSLASSGTDDVAVAAYASAMPTASNAPSTVTLSLKLLSSSSSAYTQYTIVFTID